jgi:hypothetical protein
MASKVIDNRKLTGGIITLAGLNTHTWYNRNQDGSFTINGAWNGSENAFNWILTKTTNSKYSKSGVIKIASQKKSVVIRFDTAFPDTNYYIFFSSNANSILYRSTKYSNKFVINGSYSLGEEITWFAIHKTLLTSTGFNKSGNIFAGTRNIVGISPNDINSNGMIVKTLPLNENNHLNGDKWYRNEYIISPTTSLDGIQTLPSFQPLKDKSGKNVVDANGNVEYNYSIIVSSNENINIYYMEKGSDRVKIGTSYSTPCIIDYLIVKNGVDWWNLI